MLLLLLGVEFIDSLITVMDGTKAVTKKESKAKLCVWCPTLLTRANSLSGVICQDCWRILAGAGMPDEEIFRLARLAESRRSEECALVRFSHKPPPPG